MDVKVTTTIRNIDEKEWEALVRSDNVEDSYQWYRAVEDSNIRKMRYVFIKDSGKLVAAACSFIYEERKFSLIIPLLEVKSFVFETPEQTSMIMKELEKIGAKEKLRGIAIRDLTEEEAGSLRDYMKGFVEVLMPDNTYIDLNFKTFEEYLKSLKRKTRKSVRSTLSRVRRMGVKTVVTSEFSRFKHVTYTLHSYVCEQHNDLRGLFPEEFYEALEKNLKDHAELLLFLKEDIPLAFALSFFSKTTAYINLGGVDPHYREYQGYFLIYYETIRRAIEKKLKKIYFGTTTYEFKGKIGCKREKALGFMKFRNPILHFILKLYFVMKGLNVNS